LRAENELFEGAGREKKKKKIKEKMTHASFEPHTLTHNITTHYILLIIMHQRLESQEKRVASFDLKSK